MLFPERMEEMALAVQKEHLKKAIALLASERAVHLKQHAPTEVAGIATRTGEAFPEADAIASLLVQVRTLLEKLPKVAPATQADLAQVRSCIKEWESMEVRAAQLDERERCTAERLALAQPLAELEDPIETLFLAKSVRPLLYKRGRDDPRIPSYRATIHGEMTLLLLDAQRIDESREKLRSAGCEEIDLSPLEGVEGLPAEAIASLERELAVVRSAKEALQEERRRFAASAPMLSRAEHMLALALLVARAPEKFGSTARVAIIEGYVPRRKRTQIEEALERAPYPVLFESRPAQDAPTSLQNPEGTRSFESLIELYTLPTYDEIDPTSIMAYTFPIFFGFMLADIGYGMLVLALAALIAGKWRRFAHILGLSAIATVAFGFAFGEFFGTHHLLLWELHPLVERVAGIEGVMLAALAFGVIHINLGLVLGIVNESRDGILFGILRKGSWIVLELGIVLLALAYARDANPLLGWLTAGMAILGILAGEGLKGILELPMLFSHTLSYLRLAAIGLASVSLAALTNGFGGALVAAGGFSLVAGVLIIVLGHAINLALGLLGPTLHSLRLHYAEFFMKFYRGGGTRYLPFGVVEGG